MCLSIHIVHHIRGRIRWHFSLKNPALFLALGPHNAEVEGSSPSLTNKISKCKRGKKSQRHLRGAPSSASILQAVLQHQMHVNNAGFGVAPSNTGAPLWLTDMEVNHSGITTSARERYSRPQRCRAITFAESPPESSKPDADSKMSVVVLQKCSRSNEQALTESRSRVAFISSSCSWSTLCW